MSLHVSLQQLNITFKKRTKRLSWNLSTKINTLTLPWSQQKGALLV